MAKFKVYGVNAETGIDTDFIVTADSVVDAESIASGRGVFVSSVETMPPLPPLPPMSFALHNIAMNRMAVCPLCGGGMLQKTKSSGNAAGIALALIVLIIGIVLTATCWGSIIGIPLCVCALFMGGTRTKVLQCVNCRHILRRG